MINNSFALGPEGWCSYDYHASVVADGTNVFILSTWRETGGVNDSGHVWTDHRRWSADTPEQPLSILPFIFYRNWIDAGPVDLTGAQVGLYLRGDGLVLDGAQCYFWVHAHGTRWHCTHQPLEITDGTWSAQPSRVDLVADEDLWHCSWSIDPADPARLHRVLSGAVSYGISLVGFSAEVRGRLSMDEFEIRSPD
ncbi:MAG: hypothetical protein HN559_08075 [Gemmatimonadetes bacterium]|jgi:hypothetical protein|nr:hypothetical protein [Gemmatimonadota bacterium]MBT5144724.1 hypothetical protein [Gemmatimonadota bacterium]MBT5589583.1 hypothetical protein [Gemmatimonadota bacterium]MBT5963335.1 hypothetical protein [Gemmatimonadota bacterium]MBT6627555.1 hypothetical protein [Gemmatimonadota bacterium]